MSVKMLKLLKQEIDNLQAAGLYKPEYVLNSAQGTKIKLDGQDKTNFTLSDYLNLSNDADVKAAMKKAIEKYGAGLAAQRVLGGTQDLHIELEEELSQFFHKDEAAVFASSYDANMGLFENLFNHQDHIFCDMYAHPSIIDGLDRTGARKVFFRRTDLGDLEDQLKRSPRARFRLIVTEGVFSIDGQIADIKGMCDLADEYDALVMLHDPYGVGLLGPTGRGTAEMYECLDRVHIISGSFATTLSGVECGFLAGSKELIHWVKQNCKPYVFSSSPTPASIAGALTALKKVDSLQDRRSELLDNVYEVRSTLNKLGFRVVKSTHPIIAVVTNDAVKTQKFTDALWDAGIFALGLCYPVVPKGFARIRLQITSQHTQADLKKVVEQFEEIGRHFKLIK